MMKLPPRKEFKCNDCTVIVGDAKSFLAHQSLHSQIHIQPVSFMYWTFNKFKELQVINRYMTWKEWAGKFATIDWTAFHYIYQEWSQQNTCMNNPCISCINKSMLRTMTEKRKKLLLGIIDESGKTVKSYKQKPNGDIELIDAL